MNNPSSDLYEMTFTEPEARILERIIMKASKLRMTERSEELREEIQFAEELLNKLQMRG